MRRFLLFLLLLFVGSGCAALIYEVVWFQLLQLMIGSSAVSLAVLLGVYMGGMCLGSLLLPRLISAWHHPLKLYALIEAGIGVCGLLVLYGVPHLDRVYVALYSVAAVSGFTGILLRGAICAVCLLPPTLLMGASLPAMARWVESTRDGVAWLGFFYGGNIAGAMIGAVLAGFYLLRLYDMEVATWAAAAINAGVAAVGFVLAAVAKYEPADFGAKGSLDLNKEDRQSISPLPFADGMGLGEAKLEALPIVQQTPLEETADGQSSAVYVVIALSGFCALGAEVVWTRLLSLMLGATVYTFSIILAVFLAGLGIGSSGGAALARRVKHSRVALGVCQLLLAGATAWAAFAISTLIPSPDFDPTIPLNPLDVFRMDLLRCAWAVLPAACLWGAGFPLALAALARIRPEEAHDSGGWLEKRMPPIRLEPSPERLRSA